MGVPNIPILDVSAETQGAFAATISSFLSIIKTVIAYILNYLQQVIQFMGRHPLASILLLTDFIILIS